MVFIISHGESMKNQVSKINYKKKYLPANEEIFSWIKKICSFGYRRPGTEASDKATKFIMTKFKEFGLENVHFEPVKTFAWNAEEWGLSINGEDIPCFYTPNSLRREEFGKFSSGKDGESFEIVYIGAGTKKELDKIDVKGKIVLSDIHFHPLPIKDLIGMSYFSYDPEKTCPEDWEHLNPYFLKNYPVNYYLAQKKGAIGFVGVLADYLDRNTYYNEDFSCSSAYKHEGFMKIPGVYVTKAYGEKIKNLIKIEKESLANLKLDVNITEVTVNNVLGILPGKSKDQILVHSHHDSVFQGAVQDGSGTSIVMSLAKYYGQLPKNSREKTILFATLDSHFYGYAANLHFIKKHQTINKKILIDICIEHIALEGKEVNGELVMTEDIEPRGFVITENKKFLEITKNSIINNNIERTVMVPTYTILGVETDAFHIHKSGIPIISFISGPIYLYDELDTPDKVAVDQLQPTTSMFVDIIDGVDSMSNEEISHKNFLILDRIRYYFWLFGKIIRMIF